MVEKFSSVKSQSAALKQFMPRRMRDPQTLSPCPESTPYQGRSPPAGAVPRLIPPDYGLGSPRLAFSPPTTPQTGGPEEGRQAYRFSSSESSLTLRSGKECPQKPQEAGPDRSNVFARLQHALLTQVCHIHPQGFGVQKESSSISLFQCGIQETHQAFSPNHPFLRRQWPA